MGTLDVVTVGELNPDLILDGVAGLPRLCLKWGNACGALTAGHRGGSGAFTSRADVEAFIRSRKGV